MRPSASCSASTCTTARAASAETYQHGPLKKGMVLTVEPGLCFREDDIAVTAEGA